MFLLPKGIAAMFYKKCPKCTNKIPYKYVKEYKEAEEIQCPYCCATLTVSFPTVVINSIIIGGCTGALLGTFTALPVFLIMVLIAIVTLFFQWKFDLIFSLTVKDQDIV